MSTNKQDMSPGRRKALRGLIGLPVLGGVLLGAYAEASKKNREKSNILEALNIEAIRPAHTADMSGDPVRIGVIGFGGRGQHLARVLGFATPSWIQRMREEGEEEAIRFFQDRNPST
jgi:hypothetical protein